jgi:hypothetical protein
MTTVLAVAAVVPVSLIVGYCIALRHCRTNFTALQLARAQLVTTRQAIELAVQDQWETIDRAKELHDEFFSQRRKQRLAARVERARQEAFDASFEPTARAEVEAKGATACRS